MIVVTWWILILVTVMALVGCGQTGVTPPLIPFQGQSSRLYFNNPTQVDNRDLALILAYIQLGEGATETQLAEQASALQGQPGSIQPPFDPPLSVQTLDYVLPTGEINENELALILSVLQLGSGAPRETLAARSSALLNLPVGSIAATDIREVPGVTFPDPPVLLPVTADINVPLNQEVGVGTLFPKSQDIFVEMNYPSDVEKPNRITVGGLNFDLTGSINNPVRYNPALTDQDLPKTTLLQIRIQTQQSRSQSRNALAIQASIKAAADATTLGSAEAKPDPVPTPSPTPSPTPTSTPSGLVVNSSADAVDTLPGDGICQTQSGECTLRAAIQEANTLPGLQTITFGSLPNSTILLTIPGANEGEAASGDLNILDNLEIIGPAASRITIDANGLDRIFQLEGNGSLSASNLTLKGGNSGLGGAILLGNVTSLSLTQVDLEQNTAIASQTSPGNGGAIAAVASSLVLNNCKILGNSGAGGGAIWSTNSTLSLTESLLESNSATVGGAIFQDGGSLTLEATVMNQNQANGTSSGAGGIYSSRATITLTTSLIQNNLSEGRGGGITLENQSTLVSTGSDFDGNSAGSGGGVYLENSDATLTGGSVQNNTAISGGGVFQSGGSFSPSGVPATGNGTFGGVIFTGNTPDNFSTP